MNVLSNKMAIVLLGFTERHHFINHSAAMLICFWILRMARRGLRSLENYRVSLANRAIFAGVSFVYIE